MSTHGSRPLHALIKPVTDQPIILEHWSSGGGGGGRGGVGGVLGVVGQRGLGGVEGPGDVPHAVPDSHVVQFSVKNNTTQEACKRATKSHFLK